jgi:hypothetical protein
MVDNMKRYFVSVLLILLFSIPANGTLVVLIPTEDGLVVAADSRTSLFGVFCDSQYKIIELKKPKHVAIAVTGDVAFIAPPEAHEQNICGYLNSAPRMLDFTYIVKNYLERKNVDFFKLSLEDLGSECVGEMDEGEKFL